MDFSIHRHFMCIKNIYKDLVLDFIAEKNIEKLQWYDETIMMHLDKEAALKFEFDIPAGFELRPLSVEDTFKVNSNWAHAAPGTETFIEYNIKFNPNIGLYNESNVI